MKRTSRSFATVMSAFACLYAISAAAEHSGTARSSVDASVFDGIANEALATGRTPGFAFAVVRDGKVVYAKGFGLANVEHRVPDYEAVHGRVDPPSCSRRQGVARRFPCEACPGLSERGFDHAADAAQSDGRTA
jgi:hypothetical protein